MYTFELKKKMGKHITLYINEETEQIIQENGMNISEYFRNRLKEDFDNLAGLKNRKEKLLKELNDIHTNIKLIEQVQAKKAEEDHKNLTDYHIATLKAMNLKLKENPEFFEGMIKRFSNDCFQVTKTRFMELLKEYGN